MNGHHSAETRERISEGQRRYHARVRQTRTQLWQQRYDDFVALKAFPANGRVRYESARRAQKPFDATHWHAYYRGWRLVNRWERSRKDFPLSDAQLDDVRHLFPSRMKRGIASAGRSFTSLALNPFRGARVPSQRSRLQLHRPVAVPPAQHSPERPSGA